MKKNESEKRRKDIADEILEKIGAACCYILAKITLHPKGIGFNKLYKEIKDDKQSPYEKMAKSTLSKHLKFLEKENLIVNQIDENSPYKFKPSKYMVSQFFKDISKGFIAQSTTPEDYLPLMRAENVKPVTIQLMKVMTYSLSECLKASLQSKDNISTYIMHQAFYNLETLMRAYRTRVTEEKKETIAIKAIEDWFSNTIGIEEKQV